MACDANAERSGRDRQFSLRSLLILTAILCVVFALPYGWVLIVAILGWVLLVALVAWPMIAFYRPLYRFVAGSKGPATSDNGAVTE